MMDLRQPSGLYFSLVGIVLLAAPAVSAPMAGPEVNRWCGAVMLAFGATLLLLSRRKA